MFFNFSEHRNRIFHGADLCPGIAIRKHNSSPKIAALALRSSHKAQELPEIPARRTSIADCPTGEVPQRERPRLRLTVTEQLLDLVPNNVSPHESRSVRRPWRQWNLQSRPPHVADVALVQKLVGEIRPAQEGHAVPHRLHRRVPAAVRQEAGDRVVRQHVLLRAPAHHAPARRGAAAELLKVLLARRPRPDHP
uniref:Uncharacterized protein n=1 Tax=Zea mays TaxID=4577 RepID=A0A804M485_MAIZE